MFPVDTSPKYSSSFALSSADHVIELAENKYSGRQTRPAHRLMFPVETSPKYSSSFAYTTTAPGGALLALCPISPSAASKGARCKWQSDAKQDKSKVMWRCSGHAPSQPLHRLVAEAARYLQCRPHCESRSMPHTCCQLATLSTAGARHSHSGGGRCSNTAPSKVLAAPISQERLQWQHRQPCCACHHLHQLEPSCVHQSNALLPGQTATSSCNPTTSMPCKTTNRTHLPPGR